MNMTLQEAYLKAKNEREKIGFTRLISCRDYGDFWGFMFVPPRKYGDGIADITINKKTGEKSNFIPPMDLDLAEKAVPIPIEQLTEYNVAI